MRITCLSCLADKNQAQINGEKSQGKYCPGSPGSTLPTPLSLPILSRVLDWIAMGTGNSLIGLETCYVSLCHLAFVEGAVPKFSVLVWASDTVKFHNR